MVMAEGMNGHSNGCGSLMDWAWRVGRHCRNHVIVMCMTKDNAMTMVVWWVLGSALTDNRAIASGLCVINICSKPSEINGC